MFTKSDSQVQRYLQTVLPSLSGFGGGGSLGGLGSLGAGSFAARLDHDLGDAVFREEEVLGESVAQGGDGRFLVELLLAFGFALEGGLLVRSAPSLEALLVLFRLEDVRADGLDLDSIAGDGQEQVRAVRGLGADDLQGPSGDDVSRDALLGSVQLLADDGLMKTVTIGIADVRVRGNEREEEHLALGLGGVDDESASSIAGLVLGFLAKRPLHETRVDLGLAVQADPLDSELLLGVDIGHVGLLIGYEPLVCEMRS